MKKILLFSALLCAVSFKLFAQTSSDAGKLSVALNAGLPTGSESTLYSTIIGADFKYAFPVANNVSVSFSAGYSELIGKDFMYSFNDGTSYGTIGGTAANVGTIPLKVGIRYSTNGTLGFFVEAQAGVVFFTQGDMSNTSFVYAPAIGYAFDGGLEAGVRYEGWVKDGTFSQVGLRLAYNF